MKGGAMRVSALMLALVVVLGVAVGVGAYTFVYARGASYLTNDPRACANCHVMNEQYDGWIKSSHRSVAACNDCHTPPGLIGKYTTKALNGFWHSFAFTTGHFPEPIRIGPHNRAVTEAACRHCHADVVQTMAAGSGRPGHRDEIACLRCHASVGHMELAPVGSFGAEGQR
jgi:cytochrome c nitrite reductase small subunit